jgi:hypothetical protein
MGQGDNKRRMAATCCSTAVAIVALSASAPAAPRASPSAAAAAAQGLALSPSGLGRLRIGMTLPQARAALGRRMTTPGAAPSPSCSYSSVPSLRVAVMLINGRVARVDVLPNSPVHAMGGIRRGDTESDVRAAFGKKVTKTPATYDPEGSYLTVGWRTGRHAHRGIRFEVNGNGTVTSIYAGRHDAIRYVEGCA